MARLKPTDRRKSVRQVFQKAEALTPRAPRATAVAASKAITVQQTPRYRSAVKTKTSSPVAAIATVKRKVGRPKRISPVPPPQATRVGRPTGRISDNAKAHTPRRGHPPGSRNKNKTTLKIAKASLQGHVVHPKNVPKDKVQVVVQPDDEVVQAIDGIKPKRGRARPAKSSSNTIDNLAAQQNVGLGPQDKQGRARKRKSEDVELESKGIESSENPRTKRQKLKDAAKRNDDEASAENDKEETYNHLKDPIKIAARIAKAQATRLAKKNRKFNGNRWTKLKDANAAKLQKSAQDDTEQVNSDNQTAALPSPTSLDAGGHDSDEEQEARSEVTDDIPIELGVTEESNADSDAPAAAASDFINGLGPVTALDGPEMTFTQLGDDLRLTDIVDEDSVYGVGNGASADSKWDIWRSQLLAVDVKTTNVDKATGSASAQQPERRRSASENPEAVNSRSESLLSPRTRQGRSAEPSIKLGVAMDAPDKQLRRGRSQSKEPTAQTEKKTDSGATSTVTKKKVTTMKQTIFRSVRPKVPTIQEEEPIAMAEQAEPGQVFLETGEIPADVEGLDEVESEDGADMIQIPSGNSRG